MKKELIAIAIVVFSAGLWTCYDVVHHPASERIQTGVRTTVQKHPDLAPMYEDAMRDGVLTVLESNRIFHRAVELQEQQKHTPS